MSAPTPADRLRALHAEAFTIDACGRPFFVHGVGDDQTIYAMLPALADLAEVAEVLFADDNAFNAQVRMSRYLVAKSRAALAALSRELGGEGS